MPCLFQVRNAGLIRRGEGRGKKGEGRRKREGAVTLVGRGPGSRSWFRHPEDEGQWFWPVCGFQNGEVVYVYLTALRKRNREGKWDFESGGRDYWGKIKFPELEPITYSRLPEFHGIGFGQGFVKEGKYTYAFGGKQHGLVGDVYVARFKSAEPEGDWSFWDGVKWSANVTNAAVIAQGASTSIHVCKVRDKFLLTTSAVSLACDGGREILMATSSRPTGPFSPLKVVFAINDRYRGHYPFFYFPVAHPEFINEGDELLVTYSINGYEPCVSACVKGRAIPDHYRPKAIRVPLELMEVK